MNANLTIVAEILPASSSGLQQYQTATVFDLHKLKCANPSCSIKHADITPHVRQNCDATARVLTQRVIGEVKAHVPESSVTQLYLLASTCIHEPFRNNKL